MSALVRHLLNQLKLLHFDNPNETEKADKEIQQILNTEVNELEKLIISEPVQSNYAHKKPKNYSRKIYSNEPKIQLPNHNTILEYMKKETFIDERQTITIKRKRKRNLKSPYCIVLKEYNKKKEPKILRIQSQQSYPINRY